MWPEFATLYDSCRALEVRAAREIDERIRIEYIDGGLVVNTISAILSAQEGGTTKAPSA